jgi:hypothetical protein
MKIVLQKSKINILTYFFFIIYFLILLFPFFGLFKIFPNMLNFILNKIVFLSNIKNQIFTDFYLYTYFYETFNITNEEGTGTPFNKKIKSPNKNINLSGQSDDKTVKKLDSIFYSSNNNNTINNSNSNSISNSNSNSNSNTNIDSYKNKNKISFPPLSELQIDFKNYIEAINDLFYEKESAILSI